MIKTLIDKMKKQGWTFTLIGTDNLDVEGMAGQMCIDNHLSFTEDAEGTRELFRRAREASVSYNACLASGTSIEKGSYSQDEPESHSYTTLRHLKRGCVKSGIPSL